jgi:hypothetical protein
MVKKSDATADNQTGPQEKPAEAPSSSPRPNGWKAGRKPSKGSKVNRGDNLGGSLTIRADSQLDKPERDDPAYKTFAEFVKGKEGLQDLASWSENPKAQKLFQLLDDDRYKTYGIKALAKRCGMTLPELCQLFREKTFLVGYLTFFSGVPTIIQGAVQDASPSTDVCPICQGSGTAKRDGYQVICPKCKGSGEIRVSGDKEARRDVFKAVGLLKDSPSVINQQIGNVTVEGVDNFEEVMKKATKSAKVIVKDEQEEITEAELAE